MSIMWCHMLGGCCQGGGLTLLQQNQSSITADGGWVSCALGRPSRSSRRGLMF
jgi:hypothetical protein